MPQLLLNTPSAKNRPAGKPEENPGKQLEWIKAPWVISDPHIRHLLKKDARAREALSAFWDGLADPHQALSLYREVEKHVKEGGVGYATDDTGHLLGHDYRPPYSAVYAAINVEKIGDIPLTERLPFVLSATGAEGKREVTLEFNVFEPHPVMVSEDRD